MKHFTKLCNDKIPGAMNGWDRIRFRGTIRWLASTRGLATYLGTRGIPLNKPLAIFVPVSKRRGKLIVLSTLGLSKILKCCNSSLRGRSRLMAFEIKICAAIFSSTLSIHPTKAKFERPAVGLPDEFAF